MRDNDSKYGEDGMFRKCPFCNLIWYKSQGCIGTTTCGNVPEGSDTDGWNTKLNYRIKWAIDACSIGKQNI